MNSGWGQFNDVARFQILRDRMDRENELITVRLNWLITSQSFLFTAFGLASQKGEGAVGAQLRVVVPAVAICIGTLIYLAIIAGFLALRYDRSLLLPCLRRLERDSDLGFPPIRSPSLRFGLGLVAPLVLPLLLILAWLYLLLLPGG